MVPDTPPSFMGDLVTNKNEEDLIKNERARVATKLYVDLPDAQGQITPVNGGIWQTFELLQAFIHVLITCNN